MPLVGGQGKVGLSPVVFSFSLSNSVVVSLFISGWGTFVDRGDLLLKRWIDFSPVCLSFLLYQVYSSAGFLVGGCYVFADAMLLKKIGVRVSTLNPKWCGGPRTIFNTAFFLAPRPHTILLESERIILHRGVSLSPRHPSACPAQLQNTKFIFGHSPRP